MTATDKTFEEAKPGYYIFGPKTHERQCMLCHKSFKTNMEYNRFCSHAHKDRILRELTGRKS